MYTIKKHRQPNLLKCTYKPQNIIENNDYLLKLQYCLILDILISYISFDKNSTFIAVVGYWYQFYHTIYWNINARDFTYLIAVKISIQTSKIIFVVYFRTATCAMTTTGFFDLSIS